jgi:hypothetical protein
MLLCPIEALSRPRASPEHGGRCVCVTAACMMAMFMAAIEGMIVATAMPTIVADFPIRRSASNEAASYVAFAVFTIVVLLSTIVRQTSANATDGGIE